MHHTLLEAGLSEEEALRFNAFARRKYPISPIPFRLLEVFVTRGCNLDCAYCFVHGKSNQLMTQETASRIVDFILEHRNPRAKLHVLFMGGEPTSRFDLVKWITLQLERRLPTGQSVRFNLTTNGTLLTEDMMRFFSQHKTAILLSVDGGRETHDAFRVTKDGKGTFDLVLGKLPMIRKYQPYMGTKMTPTPKTVSRLVEDVRELVRMGFCKIILGAATGVDWSAAQLTELEDQLASVLRYKDELSAHGNRHIDISVGDETFVTCDGANRWGCRAGRTGIAIDYDGSLYPCSKVIGGAIRNGVALRLGDVVEGISEREMHLRLMGVIPTTRTGCRSCGLSSVCLGGCYAVNLEATGDAFKPDPMGCSVTETVLRAYKRHSPSLVCPTSR